MFGESTIRTNVRRKDSRGNGLKCRSCNAQVLIIAGVKPTLVERLYVGSDSGAAYVPYVGQP